mgnify:CR=1 FL=1
MISCRNLQFRYRGEPFELRFEELDVASGETLALVGPSGCGKTTLMNLVSGVLVPDEGVIEVDGTSLGRLSEGQRQAFRLANLGMIPQSFELLDYLTVRDNILTPIRLSGRGRVTREETHRAEELAVRSGIASHLAKYPEQLSQGERQRVALCRGLVREPKVILADEPTGNLDPENQDAIVSLLLEEAERIAATVLMITHERELLSRFDGVLDVLALREGGDA